MGSLVGSASKATSVTQEGEPDGFVVVAGWASEATPDGNTRLCVSVPASDLVRVHGALVSALTPPISVLYRQKIDRKAPKPQGAPPRDFVALGIDVQRVLVALEAAALLVYGDARCEVWLKGALGEQLVLDEDGLVYVYPDDPAFRDALAAADVPGKDVETIAQRDYVKHTFHAEADALEAAFIGALGLTEVPHRN